MEDLRFILSDERENYKKIIVRTAGIDLADFKDNPQMLFNHNIDKPIGIWKDVYVEGLELKGVPEFDLEDPEGSKIYNKVKKNHIKTTSISIKPTNYYFIENDILYVEDSILKEASITPLPANKGAVRLFDDNNNLVADDIESIKLAFNNKLINLEMANKNKNVQVTEEVTLNELTVEVAESVVEKIPAVVEEVNLSDKITELETNLSNKDSEVIALNDKIVNLSDEIKFLKEEISAYKAKEVDSFISLAITEGKFNESQKETLLSLAATDFEAVKKLIDSTVGVKTPEVKLTDLIATKEKPEIVFDLNDKTTWSFNDWRKNAPEELKEMEAKDNVRFQKLYNDYIK